MNPESGRRILPLLLGALLFTGACASYQAERNLRSIRFIENDILLLNHAGQMLDTVYRGGRRRPNIIRGVERAAKGNKLSRDMLPGMLVFIQGYFQKAPPLYSQIPEARQYQRDRLILLSARDAKKSIPIYRQLRQDIDQTVRALRKRRDHMARISKPGKKFLAPGGVTG